MDNKNTAINNAKDAALDSVGFILTGTKAQATKLKTSSLVAARAAFAVRKNVEMVVEKFKTYEKQISDVKKALGKGDAQAQNARIRSVLAAGGNMYKQEEYEAEEKPGLAATAGNAGAAIKDAGFSLAKLLGMAALLMSPEFRGFVSGFINGFLNDLGLTDEVIKKIKIGLGIAVGLLGLYFAASTFMKVRNVFMALKELATVLGLYGAAMDAKGAVDNVEDELDRRKKTDKEGKPKPEKPGKTDLPEPEDKKGKKKGDMPDKPKKTPAEVAHEAEAKARRAKRLKRVSGLKKIKGVLNIASKVLKASLMAAVAGVAVDVVGGTLLDIAMADDDVEIDPENVTKMALNNLVSSLTFGMVDGPFKIKTEKERAAEKAAAPASAPAAAPAKNAATAPTKAGPASGPSSMPAPAAASAPAIRDQSYLNQTMATDINKKPRQTTVVNINNTNINAESKPNKEKQGSVTLYSVTVGQ